MFRREIMQESMKALSLSNEDQDDLFFKDISDLLNRILEALDPIDENIDFLQLTNITLLQAIEALDIFLQSINHLIKKCNLKDSSNSLQYLPIKELQIHLLSVIKAVLNAQKCSDEIMLADLLGHELKDNLTQWKIQILPSLKKEMTKIF